MKSCLATLILLCLLGGLAYVVAVLVGDGSRNLGIGGSGDAERESWSEQDKVAHPARYVAYLRKRIETRRVELLGLLGQYEDRSSRYELDLAKLKDEAARLESFFAKAKESYRKGCGSVEVDGVSYSEVDFLRMSVEKDKRRKEVAKAIEIYAGRILRSGKVGKNLAEQALDKLLHEDHRLQLMAEELSVNERNDSIMNLTGELNEIDSDIEALPIDTIRAEIGFGETEVERIIREGEALFDAKVD